MAIPSANVLGNPNVTEGNFQIALEQLRESVLGSGKAYDSANTYSQYDTCVYSGVSYYSKINSNTGNTPAIGTNWGLESELIKLIASPITNAIPKINADGTIKNSSIIEDVNGNIGVGGVTPSAWRTDSKFIDIKTGSFGNVNNLSNMVCLNAYNDGSWKYKTSASATNYEQYNGGHYWLAAASGTAGNAITWTNAMTLDASGRLLIGNISAAAPLTVIDGMAAFGADLVGFSGASSANTCLKLGKMLTGRSLNAAGTLNASGADYAEYEYSNDITLVKGQIVGFKEDGTLTDKYSEAIRFAIKSTNPSIVGGDVWGTEDKVGIKPQEPAKTEEITDEEFAKLEEQYKVDLADFEARLETERQKVDRIAYAGKVPVNVYDTKTGQYIIASNKDDSIIGIAVDSPTFEQYLKCVGRVNKILDDGRAEVAVIIH